MRIVSDIISGKPETTNIIAPDALVIDALQMLSTVNLSYLIVMDTDDYKGVFCERDYSRNVILKGRSSASTKVKEVMTVDLPVVGLTDSVEQCMILMNSYRTRYLLAYENDRFAGVITIHDLLRQVIASKEDVFDHSITEKLIDHEEGGKIY